MVTVSELVMYYKNLYLILHFYLNMSDVIFVKTYEPVCRKIVATSYLLEP